MNEPFDWDKAYDNMGSIANAADYPSMWAERAANYRQSWVRSDLDIAYGGHERQKYDLFLPSQNPRGLFVFVHGGYWIRMDKSYWSNLAKGANDAGLAVAIPSYILAPEARITAIARMVGLAINHAGAKIDGSIYLAGHSAGGQIVTRLISEPAGLDETVLQRLQSVVSISGLHNLHPLMKTKMNELQRIDEAEAQAESPVFLKPVTSARISAWVGGDELPEFHHQASILRQAWADYSEVLIHTDPGKHHFTILDALQDLSSPLMRDILKP